MFVLTVVSARGGMSLSRVGGWLQEGAGRRWPASPAPQGSPHPLRPLGGPPQPQSPHMVGRCRNGRVGGRRTCWYGTKRCCCPRRKRVGRQACQPAQGWQPAGAVPPPAYRRSVLSAPPGSRPSTSLDCVSCSCSRLAIDTSSPPLRRCHPHPHPHPHTHLGLPGCSWRSTRSTRWSRSTASPPSYPAQSCWTPRPASCATTAACCCAPAWCRCRAEGPAGLRRRSCRLAAAIPCHMHNARKCSFPLVPALSHFMRCLPSHLVRFCCSSSAVHPPDNAIDPLPSHTTLHEHSHSSSNLPERGVCHIDLLSLM